MTVPTHDNPVIAEITHVNSLGTATWYEIVYYDLEEEEWSSFAESTTFDDGETVIRWSEISEIVNWRK